MMKGKKALRRLWNRVSHDPGAGARSQTGLPEFIGFISSKEIDSLKTDGEPLFHSIDLNFF